MCRGIRRAGHSSTHCYCSGLVSDYDPVLRFAIDAEVVVHLVMISSQLPRRRLIAVCVVTMVVTLPLNLVHLCFPGGLRGFLFRVPTPGERAHERASSMQLVAGVNIAKEPVDTYLRKRCGVLASTPPGEPLLAIRAPQPAPDGSRTLTLTVEEFRKLESGGGWMNPNANIFGTCAQITSDGYFLTAAHCLDESLVDGRDLHVVDSAENGVSYRKARVVHAWAEPVDLAILKVDDAGPDWFPLGDASKVLAGDTVVSAGLRLDDRPGKLVMDMSHATDSAAGRIGHVQPMPDRPGFCEVTTSLPLVPGNSGGPVIDRSGELVAINTRMHKLHRTLLRWITSTDPPAYATGFEPTVIESRIHEDRQNQRDGSAPVR